MCLFKYTIIYAEVIILTCLTSLFMSLLFYYSVCVCACDVCVTFTSYTVFELLGIINFVGICLIFKDKKCVLKQSSYIK